MAMCFHFSGCTLRKATHATRVISWFNSVMWQIQCMSEFQGPEAWEQGTHRSGPQRDTIPCAGPEYRYRPELPTYHVIG